MQFDIVEKYCCGRTELQCEDLSWLQPSLALTRFHPTEMEPSDGLITRAVTWAGKKVQEAEIKEQFKKLDYSVTFLVSQGKE